MKKLFSLILGLSITVTAMAQVYLDKNAPIEDRVEDALNATRAAV
mgnify:CR=1 FL=1